MSKETAKSSVLTDYVIYGDGQFTFKVTTPEDRDRKLKILIKNSKEKGIEKMDSSALQTSEKKHRTRLQNLLLIRAQARTKPDEVKIIYANRSYWITTYPTA